MGVPKFYRWISERYPCLSEVVKEFQIPEFDNLYLDMNGIIHVCSHPDDNNPHFRITEEKIFSDIFHYLEFLFRMIKPRKVFYMAVDGVAPRAKMNQQRGRRFRSAREAEDLERKAKESGEVLPTEKRFDSNCITPGTEFMVKLQEQLKYFVVNKISNDPLWQGVDVYLSGHETPGEGEHKIMDFIRYEKSQPNYDPNTRHCLYGLDADLMMLGLATHEPHFSLLREEVKFGGSKSKNKRAATAEETTFHLLHLSLFREYLDFEFSSLKKTLPFPYNLERIIDDWILMGFLVGNDFIPHLPHLHIHHDALPTLWNVYMKVLPDCGGYLNDGGHLNLERLQKYFEELSKFDVEKFEDEYTDLKWLEGKTGGGTSSKKDSKKNNEKMGKNQFAALEEWKDEDDDVDNVNDSSPTKDVPHDGPSAVLKHFNISPEEMEDSGDTFDEEFRLHKQNYYMNKMEIEKITPEELKRQAEGYILGLQWILLYYFEGVPSWSWYFPFHYAPYISDVRDFKDFSISFDLGKPFLPFQQLMAVLPSASKELLPSCFQDLMTKDSSPIIRFYPSKFDTDLNGKQQDWEAVVLIPFIEEKLLLDTMQKVEHKMSSSESGRNCHGPSLCYSYTPENQGPYPSSLPGIYPDVVNNFAKLREIPRDQYRIPGSKMVKGLLKGCRLDVYYPGFPTLKHIKHKAFLKKEGVKVFQMNSRGENMMLEVFDNWQNDIEAVANEIIGQSVYVSWPHLYEAKVLSVSDGTDKYEIVENNSKGSKSSKSNLKIQLKKDEEKEREIWVRQAASIKERYHDRLGVNIGSTNMLISALPMVGRKYACGSHGLITLDKQFSSLPVTYCLQTSVKDITVHDSSFCQFKTIQELFPVDEVVFMLGWPHYGCQGEVVDIETNNNPKVRINVMIPNEPDIRSVQGQQQNYELYYYTGRSMAQYLGISPRTLSRLTGTVMVARGQKKVTKEKPNMGNCVNIGLNLKFTKRNEQVPGFTKLTEDGWMYTEKTQDCIEQYLQKYPEIWTFISKNEGQGDDIFYESEILPPESKTNLDKVKEFLKSLPCAKVSPQKVDASMVDEGVIQEIEKEVSSVSQVNLKKQKIKRVKMQVKPHLIYRPVPSLGNNIPDPSATYELFDRVVNVRKGYCVPFGLRGTVIGINKGEKETDTSIEIVFDESFPGGTEIRCSAGKGYTLPIWSLVNMTHGERKHDVQGVQKGKAAVAEQQRDIRNRGNVPQQYIDRNQSCAAGERQNNNFRPTRTAWQEDNAVIKHPWNGTSHQPGNYRGQQVQNMRGVQIKSRDTTTAPTFVTPKVQCNTSQNTTDSFTSPQKKAPMESEFSNMWKDLKTNSPGNKSNKSLSLSLAAAKLDSVSVPNMPPSTQSKTSPAGANKDSDNSNLKPLENNENSPMKDVKRVTTKGMNVTVENLFAKAYSERTETVASHEENASTDDSKLFEDTTAALKNMLRIGSQEEKTSESTSAPVYGRSLSVQELFDGAKKSCNKSEDVKPKDHPPAPTSKEQHRNVTNSQPRVPPPVILQMMQPGQPRFMNWFQRGPPPLQGFHGQLPQNQRNPVSDLNLLCHSMGLRPPKYEIKGNPGQYLCVVSLENGSRFQGSATKGKDEASESAAAVALLSLGPFHPAQGFPVNQMPRRNQNFPPGMPMFPQFSSPNSAFMPVSPRNTTPRGQVFQNYQNRYNHPPRGRPFHHQERFAQHPHNAYQPRASENQELRNSGPSKQDESPKQNPFVPLQVTKRRGTPRKSESETTVGDSHEMHGDENSKNRTTNASAKRNDTAGVVKPARNAEVLEKAETVLKPKTPPSHKPETQKHSGGKKKSRLAAKFNTVNNGT